MQIRGNHVVYNGILFKEDKAPVIPIDKTPGRNQEFHKNRNECLVHRFYYIFRINGTGTTYEYNVQEVAKQFFLSDFYTGMILQWNREMLLQLKHTWKECTIKELASHFKEKWPHLVW